MTLSSPTTVLMRAASALKSEPARWLAAGLVVGALCVSPALARQSIQIDDELPVGLADQLRAELDRSFETAPDGMRPSQITPAATRALIARLRSEGFYGALVRTAVRENDVLFAVSPGPRFVVGELVVSTSPPSSDAEALAITAANLEAGAPLRAQAVIQGEAQALAALQDNGWPDAVLLERGVAVDHATADGDITLNFQTGPFSRYGAVQVDGEDWRASFIQRLSPASSGEIAQLNTLRSYQDRLAALESVARAQVRLAPPAPGSDRRDIEASLTPAPRNRLEAGFSLSTSEGSGVGGAWTRRNLLGRDESLRVSAQLATLEQALEVRLSAPHWRRLNQELTLISAVRNEETDAFDQQEAVAEIDVTRRFGAPWSGGIRLGLDASKLTLNGQRTDTTSISTGLSAVFETRDSTTDATSGTRAFFQLGPALTFGDLQSGYVIGETGLRSYRRLSERTVAAGRIRLGGLIGATVNAVPADERFYAGGGGSVRGFEFQSLSPRASDGRPTGGRSVVEASAELRWRGAGRWGAVVFADTGLASSDVALSLSDLRVGLGAGLRYHFDFAPLRLDFAAPLDRRADEASLHVYLGLGQAF